MTKIIMIIFLTLFLQTGFANTVSDSIESMLSKKDGQSIASQSISKNSAKTTEQYHTFDAVNQNFSLVIFYRSSCPHCQRFAPVAAEFSKAFGFQIYAYTTDGNALPDFPESMNATASIEKTFFQENNIVVPSLFLVNVKTMQAYLVIQGEMSEVELQNTIMQFFEKMGESQ